MTNSFRFKAALLLTYSVALRAFAKFFFPFSFLPIQGINRIFGIGFATIMEPRRGCGFFRKINYLKNVNESKAYL
mgnify:CR=1 FL=1